MFQAYLSLIPAMRKALNWSRLSADLLMDLARILDERGEVLEISHKDIGRALFPNCTDPYRQYASSLKHLEADQLESGFQAIGIRRGSLNRDTAGFITYEKSQYWLAEFRGFFEQLNLAMAEAEVLKHLSVKSRATAQLEIVRGICKARGYKPCAPRVRECQSKKDLDIDTRLSAAFAELAAIGHRWVREPREIREFWVAYAKKTTELEIALGQYPVLSSNGHASNGKGSK